MTGTTPTHNPENDGSGRVTLFWAGEDREFRLNHKALSELQAATGKGPEELFFWIGQGRWGIADLRAVLVTALIGGGMERKAASELMKIWFDDTHLMPHKAIALDVLTAILVQPKDDEVPKAERGRAKPRRAKSPSATESAPPVPSA